MTGETKVCPACGKNMIKVSTGIVLTCYPAEHLMVWKCMCGHKEKAPSYIEKTEEERFRKRWEAAQSPDQAVH